MEFCFVKNGFANFGWGNSERQQAEQVPLGCLSAPASQTAKIRLEFMAFHRKAV